MKRRSNPILDYSSPAEEQRRKQTAEDKRREAIERYNEATFGERRPIAAALLRGTLFVAITVLLVLLLPDRVGRFVATALSVGFVVWEWRKEGWAPPSWDALWHRRR